MDCFDKYDNCTLCPRECHAGRAGGNKGACGESDRLKIARAALHFWEEPCISGSCGSGAIFFSGCSLRCVFCQNEAISHNGAGIVTDTTSLAKMMIDLQNNGAHNINLVTAGHFIPHVVAALDIAKSAGLTVPIVYNSSGYEKAETLKLLCGYIDIYLPDFKYISSKTALAYSSAADYPEIASAAIEEMFKQVGEPKYSSSGMLQKGLIVRHLALPLHTHEAINIIDYLFSRYGNSIIYSVMSQYTPPEHTLDFTPLNRRLSRREYNRIVEHCISLGIENGYFQSLNSSVKSFTPDFDGTGVLT